MDWFLNWIPFLFVFGDYNLTLMIQKRKNFSLLLLAGSLPVLITGIGQSFLIGMGLWKHLTD